MIKGCKTVLELKMPGSTNLNNSQIVKTDKQGILNENILNKYIERDAEIIFRVWDGQGEENFDHQITSKFAQKTKIIFFH